MIEYESTPRPVKAVRYFSETIDFTEVWRGMLALSGPASLQFKNNDIRGTLEVYDRVRDLWMPLPWCSWLIQHEDQTLSVLSDEDFSVQYRKKDPSLAHMGSFR